MGRNFDGKGINKIGKNFSTGINKAALRNTMWVSNRMSIRRHVKYIVREGPEKILGHRNDRFKEYTNDYIKSKFRALIIKSLRGQTLTEKDYSIDSEDFIGEFIRAELIFQAGLTFSSNLAGNILTNIKDNPFDLFRYYDKYERMRKDIDLVKKINSCQSGWNLACIEK